MLAAQVEPSLRCRNVRPQCSDLGLLGKPTTCLAPGKYGVPAVLLKAVQAAPCHLVGWTDA